jgi:hypothetical protein
MKVRVLLQRAITPAIQDSASSPKILFPFPRGKGLGVRFFASLRDAISVVSFRAQRRIPPQRAPPRRSPISRATY